MAVDPTIRTAVRNSAHPLMVRLSKGEVASQKASLRTFGDSDIVMVSNVEQMFSPVTGKELAKLSIATEISGDDFKDLDDLVTLTSDDGIMGVDPDLAFALVGKQMYNPFTGKLATFTADTASDDEGSDETDDNADASDDEDDDSGDTPNDLDDFDDVDDVNEDPDAEMAGDDMDDDESEEDESDESDEDYGDDEDEDSDEEDDFDTDQFALSEQTIMDPNATPEAKRAALKEIMVASTGDESVEVTDEDVQAFIDEAGSYEGEMASYALSFGTFVRKATRKPAKRAPEHASDDEFTANAEHKSVIDKHGGKVQLVNGDSTSDAKLLRILKDDTYLLETSDGKKWTVKASSVTDGDGAAMINADSAQETASESDVQPGDVQQPSPTTDPKPTDPPAVQPKPGETEQQPAPATETPPATTTEESTQEMEQVTVDAIDQTDPNVGVTLVATNNDQTEIAAFIGGVHVGTLYAKHASETASPLYEATNKLASAFRAAFTANKRNVHAPELASFGFRPVSFTFEVAKVVMDRVQAEKAAAVETASAATQGEIARFVDVTELAFVGVNKGVFDGVNDLATEIAKLLDRSGVANSNVEARRLLATHSHKYVETCLNKAKELASTSPEYIKGVSDAVARAEFIGGTTSKVVATTFAPPTPTAEHAGDVLGVSRDKPASTANRYSGVVASLGRRR